MKDDVWEVVPRLEGKSLVNSKWICKIDHAIDGSVKKYKARFTTQVFSQNEGVDYDETFSILGWRLHRMDVSTMSLNVIIEEEVYIENRDGVVVHGMESHVWRLNKALYGLKQALRDWHSRIQNYLHSLGFTKSDAYSSLYFEVVENHPLIFVLYVDYLFFTGEEH